MPFIGIVSGEGTGGTGASQLLPGVSSGKGTAETDGTGGTGASQPSANVCSMRFVSDVSDVSDFPVPMIKCRPCIMFP